MTESMKPSEREGCPICGESFEATGGRPTAPPFVCQKCYQDGIWEAEHVGVREAPDASAPAGEPMKTHAFVDGNDGVHCRICDGLLDDIDHAERCKWCQCRAHIGRCLEQIKHDEAQLLARLHVLEAEHE